MDASQLFNIQDSDFVDSSFFHEALLTLFANDDVLYGAGTYAFVSKDGADLLFSDQVLEKYLSKTDPPVRYHLLIGTDAITNERTILTLIDYATKYRTLKIQAYYHEKDGTLYHSKFSWFRLTHGGLLIIGSPNLTQKALRANKESFSVIELTPEEIDYVEQLWEKWLKKSEKNILELDDPRIKERCKNNVVVSVALSSLITRIRKKKTGKKGGEEGAEGETGATGKPEAPTTEEVDAWLFPETAEILVAEIPKSKERWKQANFDINTFTSFFGSPAESGQYRMLTCLANDDGTLSEVKSRPYVSVKSHNYRIELDVPTGTPYPDEGRVIGIFVKVAKRNFLYALSFPGEPDHDSLQQFLDTHRAKANQCVRERIDVKRLAEISPNSVLLDYVAVDKGIEDFNDIF